MEGNKADIVSEPVLAPDTSYTIPRNGLLSMLSSVSIEDIPMAIKYLVDKLATVRKHEAVDTSSHVWDDYQLSAEVIAMAPAKRKNIYGDYADELIDVLRDTNLSPSLSSLSPNEIRPNNQMKLRQMTKS